MTPNEKSQEEDEHENLATEVKDQNSIRKEQNPTAKNTAVEIATENSITRTPSTSNEHKNVIETGNKRRRKRQILTRPDNDYDNHHHVLDMKHLEVRRLACSTYGKTPTLK